MLIGIRATVVLLQLMVFMPSGITLVAAVVGLIVAFSLVVNSAIPFALALVPPPGGWNWDVFGGAAGAASLFGVVFPQVKQLHLLQVQWRRNRILVAAVCAQSQGYNRL